MLLSFPQLLSLMCRRAAAFSSDMDATMFQLRAFVHRRLYAAAEEILGEVERTVTSALYEAEVSRSKEEVESLRHQLGLLRKSSGLRFRFHALRVGILGPDTWC